ncbi:MAG: hypothetical protein LKJ25_01025 [Clostridia bacterium]|jgi:hypothetical protein|nr:hypothetical protein [Clostridia bacterium]
MSTALDILLSNELPQAEEKEVKIKRLSKAWGVDVIFKIKELGYSRVAEIKKMEPDSIPVHIVLAGVKEPDLKAKELMDKYKTVTPAETIKKILRPGEIEDLSRAIEKLSGYRENTIEEIKKK